MNLRVTQQAGLKQACLIVKRRRPRRGAEAGGRVALQAQQIDVAELQHVGIRSAVRQVARLATIDLDRRMLEDKRALLINVAFEADRILRG